AALVLQRIVLDLIAERVAGAAAARGRRVARLDHEVRDDAMEFHAVVVPLLRQEHEVVDGLRRMLRIERELDRAAIRLDRDRVVLLDVDLHRRRCRPLQLRHLTLLSDRSATIPEFARRRLLTRSSHLRATAVRMAATAVSSSWRMSLPM